MPKNALHYDPPPLNPRGILTIISQKLLYISIKQIDSSFSQWILSITKISDHSNKFWRKKVDFRGRKPEVSTIGVLFQNYTHTISRSIAFVMKRKEKSLSLYVNWPYNFVTPCRKSWRKDIQENQMSKRMVVEENEQSTLTVEKRNQDDNVVMVMKEKSPFFISLLYCVLF